MFKTVRGARRARPFALWRILVWLVMLLAAVGFVINAYGAVIAANAIGNLSPEAIAAGGPDPRILMAWSLGYTFGAFAVMVLALGTLRWREWGRRWMRPVAGVLAVWAIYTAGVALHQWQEIGVVLGQAGLPPELLVQGTKARSILFVGIVLKAVSVPALAWLAWVLGSVSVRQQFSQPAL
jgi:glucan phosphoethanolaminetransferase (alkaline phosphatase superfamily)